MHHFLHEPAIRLRLEAIDQAISHTIPSGIPALFAEVPLGVFATLVHDLPEEFPHIRSWALATTTDETENRRPCEKGSSLVMGSRAIMQMLVLLHAHHSGNRLEAGAVGSVDSAASGPRVIIFGASAGGQRATRVLPDDWTVVAFADNDPAKIGREFCGRPVIAPTEITRHAATEVIVATMHADTIVPQLEALGVLPARIRILHANVLAGRVLRAVGSSSMTAESRTADCGKYPQSWPALQASIRRYAAETQVSAEVHHADHIFRFLADNPTFAGRVDEAVRYYFHDGARSAEKLAKILFEQLNVARDSHACLLEFASGYGCVTRHLQQRLAPLTVVSCDIHPEAVDFLHNVIGAKAQQSAHLPEELRLPHDFGAVFALSFFSHMPGRTWGRWLKRLFAALKPGGHLLFTTQGLSSRKFLGEPEIPSSGFWFRADSEQKDLDVAEYGTTVVTSSYVRDQIGQLPGAKLVQESQAFWWDHQDLYIVRRD